ncbi:MAG: hypothetical protein ACO2PN_29330 [Pyrobaculum sp.]|jgi:hypothetical protein
MEDVLRLVVDVGGYWYKQQDGTVVVGVPEDRPDLAEWVHSQLVALGVKHKIQLIKRISFLSF